MDEGVIGEMAGSCVMMRTRLISRVITNLYDDELRPFGLGAAQLALLLVIHRIGPATRADIGRYHHQDRSTLTRNLKLILAEGWAEESPDEAGGRGRPIRLSRAGKDLLCRAAPAWRTAQRKGRALLTEPGADTVMAMAEGILRP
jgi:DNA-binding MarR family transcriptional regulator